MNATLDAESRLQCPNIVIHVVWQLSWAHLQSSRCPSHQINIFLLNSLARSQELTNDSDKVTRFFQWHCPWKFGSYQNPCNSPKNVLKCKLLANNLYFLPSTLISLHWSTRMWGCEYVAVSPSPPTCWYQQVQTATMLFCLILSFWGNIYFDELAALNSSQEIDIFAKNE